MELVLIGCGRISQRHVEAISSTPGLEILQVCDINEQRARELAGRLKVPWTLSIGTIADADVVTIATPSGLHPRHVMEVAGSTSAPTIVCEKPVSLTVRELVEMYDRVGKVGKRLLPVFQNRYNPLVVFLRDLVRSGYNRQGRWGSLHPGQPLYRPAYILVRVSRQGGWDRREGAGVADSGHG